MKLKQISILFLASLILMTGFASASEEKSVMISDEERLRLIAQLEGTNMTNGEFIKIALPELYDENPSKATSIYYQQEKVWFNSSDAVEQSVDAEPSAKDLPSGFMIGSSSLEKVSTKIKFSTKSTFYGVTPVEQYVYSGLYDSNNELIGFVAKTVKSTKTVEVTEYKNYAPGMYKVDGVHQALIPAPHTPSIVVQYSTSGWRTL